MPTIRNSYGQNFVRVAGVSIAPRKKVFIDSNAYSSWVGHSGNAELAAKYLEVVPDDATDEELDARDAGIATDPASMFEDTGTDASAGDGSTDATGTDAAPMTQEGRERLIDAAVAGIVGDAAETDFTKTGAIRVQSVRDRSGILDVTGDEVTAAKARYDAAQAAGDGSGA